jgi:hypothetical protein
MRLLREPFRPQWTPFMAEAYRQRRHAAWTPFLNGIGHAAFEASPINN